MSRVLASSFNLYLLGIKTAININKTIPAKISNFVYVGNREGSIIFSVNSAKN